MTVLFSLLTVSCGMEEEEESTKAEVEVDIYAKLNRMLKKAEYPVTLTTEIAEGGNVFSGRYLIKENEDSYSVDFSYDRLNYFTVTTEGKIVKPSGYKKTFSGSVKIKDGKITEKNGDEVDISVEAFSVRNFTLSEGTLTNVQKSEGRFSADIASLQAVTGLTDEVENATIEILYGEVKVTKVTLTYSTESYRAEMSYTLS